MNAAPETLTPGIAVRRTSVATRDLALLVLLGLGIALRVFQYLSGPDQWLDEIALSKAVLDLDFAALWFGPLPYDQVAPPGFLMLQKLLIVIFGPQDAVFRLVPFLSSVAALLLFCSIARRYLDGAAAFTAVLLLATAGPVIMFGGLHKQFSSELFASVAMLFLALRSLDSRSDRRETIFQTASGVMLLCLSHAASFMATAILPSLLMTWRAAPRDRMVRLRSRIAITVTWGLTAAGLAVLRVRHSDPTSRGKLDAYWAAGYPPSDPLQWPHWLVDQLRMLLGTGGEQASLAYPIPQLFLLLMLLGFVALACRRSMVAGVLACPIVAVLVAAGLRLYPFHDRTILFLLPSLFLCAGVAIEELARIAHRVGGCRRVTARLGTAGALGILATLPIVWNPPPYHMGQVARVLDYIAERRQPGDRVYAYYGAGPAVLFYGARYGFRDSDILIGGCHRGNLAAYEEELGSFRGAARVWVVLTHAIAQYGSREGILGFLDRAGTQRDHHVIPSTMVAGSPTPAEVFLYDLARMPIVDASVQSITADAAATRAFNRDACDFGPFRMLR
ncbi:MAG: ArnT family glycosyltransferase [Gammaproteobacteria bacterium]